MRERHICISASYGFNFGLVRVNDSTNFVSIQIMPQYFLPILCQPTNKTVMIFCQF